MSGEEVRMIVSALVMLVGAGFALVASVGLLRMPDLPMRLHAMSKAGTLGVGLLMLGVALFHADIGVTTRAIVTVIFLILIGPVAAHIIARAAYFAMNVPLWEGTRCNDLTGRYDREAHVLGSWREEDGGEVEGEGPDDGER